MTRSRPVPDDAGVRRAFKYYESLSRVHALVSHSLSRGEDVKLDDAARVAALEKHYFCKFFKAKTGLTYRQWIRLRMVERARELILASDDTLTTIAARSGFDDFRTFERNFRRALGMSPKEFRDSVAPRAKR